MRPLPDVAGLGGAGVRLSQQRLGGCSLICDGLRWDRTKAVVSVNRRILGNVPIRLQRTRARIQYNYYHNVHGNVMIPGVIGEHW